jgi:Homeodomain
MNSVMSRHRKMKFLFEMLKMQNNPNRSNTVFSSKKFLFWEKKILEQFYQRRKKPILNQKQKIAKYLNVDVKRIDTWFNRRRRKEKYIIIL